MDNQQPMWEQRWHPLREEWVIVAAHRQSRPWVGLMVAEDEVPRPAYVSDCYLCPGNARVSGRRNPDYASTFVFDNDKPCASPDAPRDLPPPTPPNRNARAVGLARVICYSPRHDLTLAEMDLDSIAEVARVWQRETHDAGARPEVNHVVIFENKGEVVGVSNPHPHGQLYATSFVWKITEVEVQASRRYQAETGRGLLADVLRAEEHDARRILYADEHTLAFVPYFARYAYEVYVAPRRPRAHVHALSDAEVESLARALKHVTVCYDNLWQRSFPYVMSLHQAPTDGGDHGSYHFFINFMPPLRQPNVQKFLAGAEIGGGNFLSDTSPDEKAAELRALPGVHYRAAAGAPEPERAVRA